MNGTLDFLLKIRNLNKTIDDISTKMHDGISKSVRKAIKTALAKPLANPAGYMAMKVIEKSLGKTLDLLKGWGKALPIITKKTEKLGKTLSKAVFVPFLAFKKTIKGTINVFKKFYDVIPLSIKRLMGFGAIVAIWETFRETLKDTLSLYQDLGKAAVRAGGRLGKSTRTMRKEFIDMAIDIKSNSPLLEMEDITNLITQFSDEGIDATKDLKPLVEQMAKFKALGHENADVLIPFIASLKKTGQQMPDLEDALGKANVAFGNFAEQGVDNAIQLATKTGMSLNKAIDSTGQFTQALSQFGLPMQDSLNLVEKLSQTDLSRLPASFQPFVKQMQQGNFEGAAKQMDKIQQIIRNTPVERLGAMADSLGIDEDTLARFKQQRKQFSGFWDEAGKKIPKINKLSKQYTDDTSDAMSSLKNVWESARITFFQVIKAIQPEIEQFSAWLNKTLIPMIRANSGEIASVAGNAIHGIVDFIKSMDSDDLKKKISGFFAPFKDIWAAIKETDWKKLAKNISSVFDKVAKAIDGIWKVIKSIIDGVKNFVIDHPVAAGIITALLGGALAAAAITLGPAIAALTASIGGAVATGVGGAAAAGVAAAGVAAGGAYVASNAADALTTKREAKSDESLLLSDIKLILGSILDIDKDLLVAAVGQERATRMMALQEEAKKQRGKK